MNYKIFVNSIFLSGLTVLVVGVNFPAFPQTNRFDEQFGSRIVPEKYKVLNELPIIVNRSITGNPSISYTEVSNDGRYELIEFMPTLTQEVRELPVPQPRTLYRLAKVRDRQTGKVLEVALPIRFEP